jgi:hypothetical protein
VLLTSQETAELLRLVPGTLANWRVAGFGPPFIRLGRRVLYDQEVVLAWARSKTVNSTTEARS